MSATFGNLLKILRRRKTITFKPNDCNTYAKFNKDMITSDNTDFLVSVSIS